MIADLSQVHGCVTVLPLLLDRAADAVDVLIATGLAAARVVCH